MHKMHNKNAKLFIAKFPLDLYAFFLFSQHITEPQKRIIENLNSFPCCSVEKFQERNTLSIGFILVVFLIRIRHKVWLEPGRWQKTKRRSQGKIGKAKF